MLKRTFDILLALGLAALLSPVLISLTVLIKYRLGSPVFFIQPRPGRDGKIFNLVKFRTMTDARNAKGELLDDAERLTPFGSFLRRSSLDELPELWNVCIGEMSFVGPRPLLVEYLPLYTAEQARRHDVRPGITGWAQINGRNALSWEEKFELDLWYIDNRSFILDLKILWRTLRKITDQSDISAKGSATMERFRGS